MFFVSWNGATLFFVWLQTMRAERDCASGLGTERLRPVDFLE
jgi:hypothetical protein